MLRMGDGWGRPLQFSLRGHAPCVKRECGKGCGVDRIEDSFGATVTEASILARPAYDIGLSDDGHRHGGAGKAGQVLQLPKHPDDAAGLLKLFRRYEIAAPLFK